LRTNAKTQLYFQHKIHQMPSVGSIVTNGQLFSRDQTTYYTQTMQIYAHPFILHTTSKARRAAQYLL